MRYFVFSDESSKREKYFSNFYSGAIINAKDFEEVNSSLKSTIRLLDLEENEIKWECVNKYRIVKYCSFIDSLFEYIYDGKVKIRVMFTDNSKHDLTLTKYHKDHNYHILYHEFLKHSFGFEHIEYAHIHFYIDHMPENEEKKKKFKEYLCRFPQAEKFKNNRLIVRPNYIYEVKSHDHILLQCADLLGGAVNFKLNKKHLTKHPNGQTPNRTAAKEEVFQHIYKRLCKIRNNFNLYGTTGVDGDKSNRFRHPYRHWCFESKNSTYRK